MHITHVQRKASEAASSFFPLKEDNRGNGRALYNPYNYLTWSLRFAWTEQVVQY